MWFPSPPPWSVTRLVNVEKPPLPSLLYAAAVGRWRRLVFFSWRLSAIRGNPAPAGSSIMRGTPRRAQARQKTCPLRANGALRPTVPPADRRRCAAGVSAVTLLWGWFPCWLVSSPVLGLCSALVLLPRLCVSGVLVSPARGLSSSLSGLLAGGVVSCLGVPLGLPALVCFGGSALLVAGGVPSVVVSFAVFGCLSGVWVPRFPGSVCAGWRRGCRSSALFRRPVLSVGVLWLSVRLPGRLPFGLGLVPEGSSRGGGFSLPCGFFYAEAEE